jgi:hypothetical protein
MYDDCTMGKYRYCRLPMGLSGSPDIFQAIINDIMGDLPNVRAYLDDILITTAGSYEDHLMLNLPCNGFPMLVLPLTFVNPRSL